MTSHVLALVILCLALGSVSGVAADQFAITIGSTVTNGMPAAGAGNIESHGATDTYTFTGTAGLVLSHRIFVGAPFWPALFTS